MKVGFYFKYGENGKKIDLNEINKGNPGIGGTQYLFLLIVKYLNIYYGNGFATLFTDSNFKASNEDIPISYASSLDEGIEKCKKDKVDIMVINCNDVNKDNEKVFKNTNINIIVWAHNTVPFLAQKIINKYDSIKKIVCVSKSQMMNMVDSKCFRKCTYINNTVTKEFIEKSKRSDYSMNKVIYVGSLYPQKGVQNLLDIWNIVLRDVPDAKLIIIGSAKVWNKNIEVGELGVAPPAFERILIKKLKKLSNSDSVEFLGTKNWCEINEYIKDAKVGVVNPSTFYRDETFCMSAIEMNAHGIPVISRYRNDGLSSTIINGENGYLEKGDKKIASGICKLLLDKDLCKEMGRKSIENVKRFYVDDIIHDWKKCFDDLCNNNTLVNGSKIFPKDTILLKIDKLHKGYYKLRRLLKV